MRINAKKLRYLVDVAPAFYDAADLDRILAALKKLQRVLGDFNDAQVAGGAAARLRRARLVATGGPAGALLALGRLAEQSRQRRERLRGEVADGLAAIPCARHAVGLSARVQGRRAPRSARDERGRHL